MMLILPWYPHNPCCGKDAVEHSYCKGAKAWKERSKQRKVRGRNFEVDLCASYLCCVPKHPSFCSTSQRLASWCYSAALSSSLCISIQPQLCFLICHFACWNWCSAWLDMTETSVVPVCLPVFSSSSANGRLIQTRFSHDVIALVWFLI